MRTVLLVTLLAWSFATQAQVGGSKVLVLSNAAGQVLIDGTVIGDIEANKPLIQEVAAGDHLVQLAWSNNGRAEIKNEMITVEAGKQKAVSFSVEQTAAVVLSPAAERVLVADQNVLVSGVLVNSLNGVVKPSEFMYGFEAGDEAVLDITMSNLKGTNSLTVSTYPGGVVLYSNLAFQALTDQRFKIQERGILKFSLTTNHVMDRNAFVKVWRIPASAATAVFNTNVVRRKIYSTLEVVEKHEMIVNSRSNMTGSTRQVVPVSLPANTAEWYYRFSARKIESSTQASTNTLVGELAGALIGSSAMVGTVSGLLGALSTPMGAEACDIFLIDQANYSPFLSKSPDFQQYAAASRTNLNSGNVRVDCCLQGQWYLGLRNNAFSDGIKVQLEVVAITALEDWAMEANSTSKP